MQPYSITRLAVLFFALSGCMTAAEHADSLHSAHERNMTLGTVQTTIKRGMPQADVAEALGAPNIVTKDQSGGDTWIYDKIATEASYSNDKGGVSGLAAASGMAGSTLLLGGVAGNYSRNAGASASTQRTLTVVIKFDAQSRVRDFSYHSSEF